MEWAKEGETMFSSTDTPQFLEQFYTIKLPMENFKLLLRIYFMF